MIKLVCLGGCILAAISLAAVSAATIRVEGLRCEYLVDPLGIDEPRRD